MAPIRTSLPENFWIGWPGLKIKSSAVSESLPLFNSISFASQEDIFSVDPFIPRNFSFSIFFSILDISRSFLASLPHLPFMLSINLPFIFLNISFIKSGIFNIVSLMDAPADFAPSHTLVANAFILPNASSIFVVIMAAPSPTDLPKATNLSITFSLIQALIINAPSPTDLPKATNLSITFSLIQALIINAPSPIALPNLVNLSTIQSQVANIAGQNFSVIQVFASLNSLIPSVIILNIVPPRSSK